MKTLELTKDEIELLQLLIWENPCSSGCALEDMINSKKDCPECRLTKTMSSLMEKIEKLQP
jgi:hypothetical protein